MVRPGSVFQTGNLSPTGQKWSCEVWSYLSNQIVMKHQVIILKDHTSQNLKSEIKSQATTQAFCIQSRYTPLVEVNQANISLVILDKERSWVSIVWPIWVCQVLWHISKIKPNGSEAESVLNGHLQNKLRSSSFYKMNWGLSRDRAGIDLEGDTFCGWLTSHDYIYDLMLTLLESIWH